MPISKKDKTVVEAAPRSEHEDAIDAQLTDALGEESAFGAPFAAPFGAPSENAEEVSPEEKPSPAAEEFASPAAEEFASPAAEEFAPPAAEEFSSPAAEEFSSSADYYDPSSVYTRREFPAPIYDEPREAAAPVPTGKIKAVPAKTTLNLCMKEKQLISPVVFTLVLLVILLLAGVIGYFGVYQRYEKVNEAQAQLDADRARLQQLLDQTSDYDSVKEQYNKYNYEEYDKSIADRLDVLSLIERTMFPVSSMRTLSISGKTLTTSLTGLDLGQIAQLVATLEADDLVEKVEVRTTGYTSSETDSVPTVNLTIMLADASQGGK